MTSSNKIQLLIVTQIQTQLVKDKCLICVELVNDRFHVPQLLIKYPEEYIFAIQLHMPHVMVPSVFLVTAHIFTLLRYPTVLARPLFFVHTVP